MVQNWCKNIKIKKHEGENLVKSILSEYNLLKVVDYAK